MFINENKISKKAILNFLTNCDKNDVDLHGIVIYNDNEPVFQMSYEPYGLDDKRQQYSLSKTFTATAIGILIDDKKICVEDYVISYFQDMVVENPSENLKKLKIKHLLSMNTGHDIDTTISMVNANNPIKTFFEIPIVHEPGTHFLYNTGATVVLSAIVTKVTNQSTRDFLDERLFKHIGIKTPHWGEIAPNISEGGYGIHISAHDIAKLGLLYFNKGVCNGKRLLSEEYIEEAIKKHSDNSIQGATIDWQSGYGYQIWVNARDGFRADGSSGQFCYISPKNNLVIAMVSECVRMQDEMDLLFELASQINCDSENITKNDLEAYISNHNDCYETKEKISEFSFNLSKNIFLVDKVSFSQNEDGSLNFWFGKTNIVCGNGKWIKNEFKANSLKPIIGLVRKEHRNQPISLAASYKIINEEIFIYFRYLDCPHKQFIHVKNKTLTFSHDAILMDEDNSFLSSI